MPGAIFKDNGNGTGTFTWAIPENLPKKVYNLNFTATNARGMKSSILATINILTQHSITIDPNPCILQPGKAVCTVNVSWQTPVLSQIWVKMDRQPEKLFACGTSKTQTATWIQKNHTYQFNMYSTSTCSATETHTTAVASATTTAIYGIFPGCACHVRPAELYCTYANNNSPYPLFIKERKQNTKTLL